MSPSEPPAEWIGSSGQCYRFDVYPIDARLPPVPGCYVIVRLTETRPLPVFIGESGNLSRLLDGHPQARCIAAKGATQIHAHEAGNAIRRLSEVADLIDHWVPPCNALSVRVV